MKNTLLEVYERVLFAMKCRRQKQTQKRTHANKEEWCNLSLAFCE